MSLCTLCCLSNLAFTNWNGRCPGWFLLHWKQLLTFNVCVSGWCVATPCMCVRDTTMTLVWIYVLWIQLFGMTSDQILEEVFAFVQLTVTEPIRVFCLLYFYSVWFKVGKSTENPWFPLFPQAVPERVKSQPLEALLPFSVLLSSQTWYF